MGNEISGERVLCPVCRRGFLYLGPASFNASPPVLRSKDGNLFVLGVDNPSESPFEFSCSMCEVQLGNSLEWLQKLCEELRR